MGRTTKCLSNWVTQGLRRGRANAERGMRNGKGKAEPSFAKASEGRLRDGGGGEPTRNAERGMDGEKAQPSTQPRGPLSYMGRTQRKAEIGERLEAWGLRHEA